MFRKFIKVGAVSLSVIAVKNNYKLGVKSPFLLQAEELKSNPTTKLGTKECILGTQHTNQLLIFFKS